MSETGGARPADHVVDLLPAMALGAATDDDRARVEAHLPGCEPCRREFEGYEAVGARLRMENPLPPAPPALWERIERGIAAADARPPAGRRSWGSPSWAAAAVIAVIAGIAGILGGLAAAQFGEDDDTFAELDDIATGDVVFTLASADPALDANGRIFMSTDRTRGVVAVTGLSQLPETERYAVWLVKDDNTRENVGTFVVDDDGNCIASLSLPYLPGDWEQSGEYVALSISRVHRANPLTPLGGQIMVGPIY